MTIIFAFILIGLTSIVGDCQDIKIHLIHTDSNDFGYDQITIQNKKSNIVNIVADKDGFVYISRTLFKDSIDYDLFLTTIGVKGTYLTTINSKTNGLTEISLPKAYKTRLGKAICPKCSKINKVSKIIYYDAPIAIMKIAKGDTIYSPNYKNRLYRSSEVPGKLDPKWYCKRDDIYF
jgi:hypothetical protein